MGWLLASIFFGLAAIGGLMSLFSGDLEQSEIVYTLISIPLSGFLSYYFLKRYKNRDLPKIIESEKLQKLEEGLPVITDSPLFLKGETLHYLEPATLLITKNKIVGRTGGGGGVSIRLAKGIYARTGSFGGTPIYRDVTSKFKGQLAVTNNRILFVHPHKGFEIQLEDISLINPYSDGVSIQTKNKAYSFLLKEPRYFMGLVEKIMDTNSKALA